MSSARSTTLLEVRVLLPGGGVAQDSGLLRTDHGDRLVVLYGRGVAALEVAPRGAIL